MLFIGDFFSFPPPLSWINYSSFGIFFGETQVTLFPSLCLLWVRQNNFWLKTGTSLHIVLLLINVPPPSPPPFPKISMLSLKFQELNPKEQATAIMDWVMSHSMYMTISSCFSKGKSPWAEERNRFYFSVSSKPSTAKNLFCLCCFGKYY